MSTIYITPSRPSATPMTGRTLVTTSHTTRTSILRYGSYLCDRLGNRICDRLGNPFIVYDANGTIPIGTAYTTRTLI